MFFVILISINYGSDGRFEEKALVAKTGGFAWSCTRRTQLKTTSRDLPLLQPRNVYVATGHIVLQGGCWPVHPYSGKFESACRYSHDQDRRSAARDKEVKVTTEQLNARAGYIFWRAGIRHRPQANGLPANKFLWDGALVILNGDNRDWKQALPKDLDNEHEYFGKQHIQALLCERAQVGQFQSFIETSRSFFLVMTHPSIVDCLSVDTYIASLYSFMSGVNGTRAIPFFQHVCEIVGITLAETHRTMPMDKLNSTLVALVETLSELLNRESRARFNEGLPELLKSLETSAELMNEESLVTSSLIIKQVEDLRSMVNRAYGLLSAKNDAKQEGFSTSFVQVTCPRDVVKPGGRHDNDKTEITAMDIFPTRDEIMSDMREFLPSTDPDQPHFLNDKVERYIDTYFRLLRHDVFGQLKDDIGSFMKSVVEDPNQIKSPRLGLGDTRMYSYSNAFVKYLLLDKSRGFQARMSFHQPRSFRKGQKMDRRSWWEESRRLEEGVLLSFVWVQDSLVQHLFFTVLERSTDPNSDSSLTQNENIATITVKLTNQDKLHVEALLRLSCQKNRGVLLEFPHILPATFTPVLKSLQNMQRLNRLPFHEWILPDRIENSGVTFSIPPPFYARHTSFNFPLGPILNDGVSTMSLPSSSSENDLALMAELEAKTGLDHGQCAAFIAALTREFAYIQGPPGTGKSYVGVKIMQILLHVKTEANLGPIIVMCYTNHALDQFLEHLIATGIRKIVRIGGQSRSELLEGYNLRNITRTETKSRHECWQVADAYNSLESHADRSKRILGRIHGIQKRVEWRSFEHLLARKYRRIYAQFNVVGGDGFRTVGQHPFDKWMSERTSENVSVTQPTTICTTSDPASVIKKAEQDVQVLSFGERQILLKVWTQELQQDAEAEFFEIVKDAEDIQGDLTNVHEEVNRRVLQNADVIGLTTTGLAKSSSTLQRVRSKVVICEEAGEVMEPHVMSALLKSVEHFIQIGDHQQLRPSINNFRDLSLESDHGKPYQLDRSQFERLSIGQPGRPLMPVAQLNIQRRMRPEISKLIRETIYGRLEDHPYTVQLPDVIGMRRNVFWLDHDNLEDEEIENMQHNTSKSNDWEVQMVHALVRHLVRQGVYCSSDIAVLTPYTGQLQRIRTAMRNDFEIVLSDRDEDALTRDGFTAQDSFMETVAEEQDTNKKPLEKKKLSDLLRIATVDNFQGEEAKIIVVSLVRSNKHRKVGFLKTTNRINVLLSRAQHGLYLIGNTDTYSFVPMWQRVVNMLRAQASVGSSLELCCPRHKDTAIHVQQPDDFLSSSPEGGCRERCTDRLPDCGHRCQARCHSQRMHKVFHCEQPCQRQHQPCNHPCQKPTCGEPCGRCIVPLDGVILRCGHSKENVLCYRTQDLSSIRCNVVVTKTVSGCGHAVEVPCYRDVDSDAYSCSAPCTATLRCGHTCPGSCGRCNSKDLDGSLTMEHRKCDKVCGRHFGTCNHTCPRCCHDGSDCGLCMSACEVACKHSRCNLRCHEACAPCIERCTWSCPHKGQCTMPCSAPCNRIPCDERCIRVLPCGHQCPGICGEVCLPEHCQSCEMKIDAQVDMVEFKEYAEIDLDDTPIVALTCGHFFTIETLDGLIGLKEVYKLDPVNGRMIDLKDISCKLSPAIPRCPHCQQRIRQYTTQRYNRLINRAVIDEMSKRFIVTGQTALQEIQARLVKLETALKDTRPDAIRPSLVSRRTGMRSSEIQYVTWKLRTRYKPVTQLRSDIVELQRRTAKNSQPVHKLHDAMMHAMHSALPLVSASAGLQPKGAALIGEHDDRIALKTKMMQVKTDRVILEDKLSVNSAVRAAYGDSAAFLAFSEGSPSTPVRNLLQSCASLITACKEKALSKIAVELSLCYAQIVQLFERSGLSKPRDREMAAIEHENARSLLEGAAKLCEQRFHDAETLLQAVNQSLDFLQTERYEGITNEELEAVKSAMVSGSMGIATHSGHWYNCANGHPFAIGECGLPMELARCPECGAEIGGQHHEAVQGVTRAEAMER